MDGAQATDQAHVRAGHCATERCARCSSGAAARRVHIALCREPARRGRQEAEALDGKLHSQGLATGLQLEPASWLVFGKPCTRGCLSLLDLPTSQNETAHGHRANFRSSVNKHQPLYVARSSSLISLARGSATSLQSNGGAGRRVLKLSSKQDESVRADQSLSPSAQRTYVVKPVIHAHRRE